MVRLFRKKYRVQEIAPDEIFIDAENLPEFDRGRFEGRLEQPIGRRTLLSFSAALLLLFCILGGKIYSLEIVHGATYADLSENNRLHHSILFSERGSIFDRTGMVLATNEVSSGDFALRRYAAMPGLSHVVGYVTYPAKDSSGFYYQERFLGKDGVEAAFDTDLSGSNGIKITETDASGDLQSESTIQLPKNGKDIHLSIDARVQSALFDYIKKLSESNKFVGGAGVIMDVDSGRLLALSSYPEYNSQVLTDGKDREKINGYLSDSKRPFLNRALSGLYAPGSIVKPFIALGALEEKVITPEKEILSTGSISVPNPYAPQEKSVFLDWKAHGLVDMRAAIAVSSDVYFYEIGGGFDGQKGLGISLIKKYLSLFGFGEETGIQGLVEESGVIPDPIWKLENFDGEPWRLGDTYHTAIGQYGTQSTAIQAVRATAALGNGGYLITPSITLDSGAPKMEKLSFDFENLKVVLEGMRQAVHAGTAKGLDIPQVTVAAKTGTAEVGITKRSVNSWIIGLFPAEHPRFAFAVVMERGPRDNTVGGLYVMRQLLEWMSVYTPEYLASE